MQFKVAAGSLRGFGQVRNTCTSSLLCIWVFSVFWVPEGTLAGAFRTGFPGVFWPKPTPGTPPDRRGPPRTSSCTKISPGDQILRQFRGEARQTAIRYPDFDIENPATPMWEGVGKVHEGTKHGDSVLGRKPYTLPKSLTTRCPDLHLDDWWSDNHQVELRTPSTCGLVWHVVQQFRQKLKLPRLADHSHGENGRLTHRY